MTDYGDRLQPSRGPSFVQSAIDGSRRSSTRTSYYNHNAPSINATTRSWVHSQQNTPVPPSLPLPTPLPTRVHPPRPLPDPPAQHHRSAALYIVNPSEPLDREEVQERVDNIRFADRISGANKLRKPPIHNSGNHKKRTVMGGFVESIRRIPKIVFRYGSGKETTDGEGTSISTTGVTTGNTRPQYASDLRTPVVAPVPSHPHLYPYQQMEMQIPRTAPVLGPSPPPEVVRLDDVRRHRPDFRIIPPSINVAHSETAHFFPGTTTSDNPTDSSSSAANAAERTTTMLYNQAHHTPTLTPPSRQISSNGLQRQLSNVGSERILRPTSFHGGSQAPPPIEIPTSISRMATTASYLSYVSQPTSLPPTLPNNVTRSSSQLRSHSNQTHPREQHQPTSPPENQQASVAPTSESSEPIQSPITAHPQPTTDYLKMAFSPPHSLHNDATNLNSPIPHSSSGITSFSYDPSFSKPPRLIERFFKTLYRMPWIAYERITVDYLPGKVGHVHGHGLRRERRGRPARHEKKVRRGGDGQVRDGRRRKDRDIRVSRGDGDGRNVTWYKGHSKITSVELDPLTSDLGSHSSPSTTDSLGAVIGLGLENLPADAATAALKDGNSADRKRRQREPKENLGDKQGRTSRSRRHDHGQDRHRGRQGRRITPEEENGDESFNRAPSPLIPAVYPFYYPPYPFTYPYAVTIRPLPGPQAQSQSESPQDRLSPPSEALNDHTQSSNQREPGSSRANHGQPQPVLYNPAAAHAYQPMVAPLTMTAPQVYLLHSASHGQLQTQPLSTSSPSQNGQSDVEEP